MSMNDRHYTPLFLSIIGRTTQTTGSATPILGALHPKNMLLSLFLPNLAKCPFSLEFSFRCGYRSRQRNCRVAKQYSAQDRHAMISSAYTDRIGGDKYGSL